MKFEYIFAAFKTKRTKHNPFGKWIFYIHSIACICKDKGLFVFLWLPLTNVYVGSLGRENRKRTAFFLSLTQISLTMTKRNEIRARKNHSITRSTSGHETVDFVPYSAFQTEMDAKNKAYHFILSCDLLDEFVEFCERYCLSDPQEGCQTLLLSKESTQSNV